MILPSDIGKLVARPVIECYRAHASRGDKVAVILDEYIAQIEGGEVLTVSVRTNDPGSDALVIKINAASGEILSLKVR